MSNTATYHWMSIDRFAPSEAIDAAKEELKAHVERHNFRQWLRQTTLKEIQQFAWGQAVKRYGPEADSTSPFAVTQEIPSMRKASIAGGLFSGGYLRDVYLCPVTKKEFTADEIKNYQARKESELNEMYRALFNHYMAMCAGDPQCVPKL